MADAIRRVERRKTIIVTGASEKCDVNIEIMRMCVRGRLHEFAKRINVARR
jgi:hypothetical protein